MDRSKAILLWVAGFAGVVLVYAAFKGESPLDVVTNGIAPAKPAPATPAPATATPSNSNPSYTKNGTTKA